jgi:hypothetical protein
MSVIKTEEFADPNKVSMVLSRRTGAHREDDSLKSDLQLTHFL